MLLQLVFWSQKSWILAGLPYRNRSSACRFFVPILEILLSMIIGEVEHLHLTAHRATAQYTAMYPVRALCAGLPLKGCRREGDGRRARQGKVAGGSVDRPAIAIAKTR
jgi:hypothetical protein